MAPPGNSIIDVDLDPEQVALPGGDREHPISSAEFVRWLLGATLTAMALVAGVNAFVDPTGVTGRSTRWLVAENSEVRSAKIDLYTAAVARGEEPEVVLLGSSRVMKFDPSVAEQLTGRHTFNAAVSGGVPRDAWLFTQLIEERQGESFPHLAWGLDVDAFRDKQLRDGLATDPRMSRFVSRSERIATMVASAGTLTELQTLKAAIRSVATGGSRGHEAQGRRFSDAGLQLWSLPLGATVSARERLIRAQVAMYAGFIFERDSYDGVEPEPLDEFRRVIRIANAGGDRPTIFLTPYHPLAEDLLERYGLEERAREVRDVLGELQDEGELDFELVDLSRLESFDGDDAGFYDGIHMTPDNTERVLEQLHERGALAGIPTP